jgi:hypothetical protein
MRAIVVLALFVALGAGCAETVRCPSGQYFGRDGTCIPIPDGGPPRPDAAGDASNAP